MLNSGTRHFGREKNVGPDFSAGVDSVVKYAGVEFSIRGIIIDLAGYTDFSDLGVNKKELPTYATYSCLLIGNDGRSLE